MACTVYISIHCFVFKMFLFIQGTQQMKFYRFLCEMENVNSVCRKNFMNENSFFFLFYFFMKYEKSMYQSVCSATAHHIQTHIPDGYVYFISLKFFVRNYRIFNKSFIKMAFEARHIGVEFFPKPTEFRPFPTTVVEEKMRWTWEWYEIAHTIKVKNARQVKNEFYLKHSIWKFWEVSLALSIYYARTFFSIQIQSFMASACHETSACWPFEYIIQSPHTLISFQLQFQSNMAIWNSISSMCCI